ncbi:DUF523 domain-containing protein [Thermus scotoductus]|uniref:DUF523 domain-containing protein n=1 Tax=Thermus scotoductus TaxID=37636 RepID=UPI002092E140|nr:hypothetical protein [Thermus scotoductus]
MVKPQTGEDLTQAMVAFSQGFWAGLPPVEGFILKNRSPSCALKDARVYAHPQGVGRWGTAQASSPRRWRGPFPSSPRRTRGGSRSPASAPTSSPASSAWPGCGG